MKNILVTGGAGYIGSHIVELLEKKKSNNIYILDNLSTGHKKLINKNSKFIKGDIKNFNLLKKIIKNKAIETIIHLAAHLNVSEAEKQKNKYYRNNVIGTKNLLLACKNSNVRNIIFSSSCSVYGSVKGSVNEKKKTKPEGYYAFTKLKGEELIKKYSKKFKYNYGIFRYFNVAGASSSGKVGEIQISYGHLIKNLAIQSLKKNPVINIFGNNYPTKDGTCIRDYIHVSDLANIHIKGIKYLENYNKSFILNCGYGKGYSVLEIIKIFKKTKKNLKINYLKKRLGDVAHVYADTKKINKLLKYKPKFNKVEKIVKSAIDWERNSY